jgi:hypothetical protein
MNFIDRSPGAFIGLAAFVVYGVIAVEIWMWTAESAVAVAATLLLIIACAVMILRFALHLMDDGSGVEAVAAAPAPAEDPAAILETPAPRSAAPSSRPRIAHPVA